MTAHPGIEGGAHPTIRQQQHCLRNAHRTGQSVANAADIGQISPYSPKRSQRSSFPGSAEIEACQRCKVCTRSPDQAFQVGPTVKPLRRCSPHAIRTACLPAPKNLPEQRGTRGGRLHNPATPLTGVFPREICDSSRHRGRTISSYSRHDLDLQPFRGYASHAQPGGWWQSLSRAMQLLPQALPARQTLQHDCAATVLASAVMETSALPPRSAGEREEALASVSTGSSSNTANQRPALRSIALSIRS